MGIVTRTFRLSSLGLAIAILIVALTPVPVSARATGLWYAVTNLVADQSGKALHMDPDLVNAWGIAFNPYAYVWVANAETSTSTLYDGNGHKQSLVVTTPEAPTGLVYSGGPDFLVNGTPSRFIFATERGAIGAWAPPSTGTTAVVVASVSGAIYKGLALAATGSGRFLYAADFHNGRIDVFDAAFKRMPHVAGAFSDPALPAGYAPFGIHNIGGALYVTYAKQDEDREDDVTGPGFGFVDVFDANGMLIERFASRGALNAPWGIALAPADFGRFSNALLVGNFGDGRINAFDFRTRTFLGPLRSADGRAIAIDGLWGLAFGNGVLKQPTHTLFVTAGPDDEAHGLYARIDPVPVG